MKMKLSLGLLTVMLALAAPVATPVAAQTALFIPVQDSYDYMEQKHFIFLDEGNVWEYEITASENGVPTDPSYIRYTFEQFRTIDPSIHDYVVRIDFYNESDKYRQTRCLVRLNRLRVNIGSNVTNFSDCNYQSPFSQQDMQIADAGSSVAIGQQSYPVDRTGVYQHFWGDQNGDNGYISFSFADGIGLYLFESQTRASAFSTEGKDSDWRGRLIYARIDGDEFGESEIEQNYLPTDLAPRLTPAQ